MSLFDTGIRPAVDGWLLKKSKEVRDYGEYWSASSAGYCMRKVIFERLGVPPVTEDARKQRVFSSGDIFHEWLQRITKETGLSIAQELELQDEDLMIRGHIDDLVLIKGEGVETHPNTSSNVIRNVPDHLILYDYKTQNSRAFSYMKGREMSHYHRYQLASYMYMLRRGSYTIEPNEHTTGYNEGQKVGKPNFYAYPQLTEARILKISKDDLRMAEEQLLWTPALEKEVVAYWSTLNGYWREKKMPRCTCAEFEKNDKTGIGFMADPRYNPFYYEEEPCSLKWYAKCKEEGLLNVPSV